MRFKRTIETGDGTRSSGRFKRVFHGRDSSGRLSSGGEYDVHTRGSLGGEAVKIPGGGK